MTLAIRGGETTTQFYERAAVELGPAIRERLDGMVDDGEHVFVLTWQRSDGSTDLIVWTTLDKTVASLARSEACGGPAPAVHWVVPQ